MVPDVVLGMPFLEKNEPAISWSRRLLSIVDSRGVRHVLRSAAQVSTVGLQALDTVPTDDIVNLGLDGLIDEITHDTIRDEHRRLYPSQPSPDPTKDSIDSIYSLRSSMEDTTPPTGLPEGDFRQPLLFTLRPAAEPPPKTDGWEEKIRQKLPPQLHDFVDLYNPNREEWGVPPTLVEHEIRLKPETQPHYVNPYRMAPDMLDELKQQLDKLLAQGRIAPTNSPWGTGCLLAPKPNGKWRLCIDYRALNMATTRDRYPLPNIQNVMSTLHGSTVFSKIDLVAGFHQIPLEKQSRSYTAFNTPFGAYEWHVMPFGLCNAPSTFQRYMNRALRKGTSHNDQPTRKETSKATEIPSQ
jgi:hypothetical protein